MRGFLVSFFLSLLAACHPSDVKEVLQLEVDEEGQEKIIQQYLKEGAWQYHYLHPEWERWIDKGLQQDSTIAYLWQQKAMPYWKTERYDLALEYINKAVELDRKSYLTRRLYLKTVFKKDYKSALEDIYAYRSEFGAHHGEQDHSHEFWEALCYLQLKQPQKALDILEADKQFLLETYGAQHRHFLDDFYLAISYMELERYEEALIYLNKVLEEYDRFSDAYYYKAQALKRLGRATEEWRPIALEGLEHFKAGYTFNEDGSVYEQFPFQVTWQWALFK